MWNKDQRRDVLRSRAHYIGIYLNTTGMEWITTTALRLHVDKSKFVRECLLLAREHEEELQQRIEEKYHQM